MKKIMKSLKSFAKKINNDKNALLYLVGGAVRDMAMGNTNIKDFDLEVFNIKPSDFLAWLTINNFDFALEPNAKFPVVRMKIEGEDIEIGFPRKENKTGSKHSDYDIEVVPDMSFKDAARRRDFTFNAIGYNLLTDEYIDPYDGIEDIKNKRIRVVNKTTFREDALRILRAMQFIARFELDFDELLNSGAINQAMIEEVQDISSSSIWGEIRKMIHKGTKAGIQKALNFMYQLSKRFGLFPIFDKMLHTRKYQNIYPEVNVWNHTLMVVDNVPVNNELYFLTALCHDMGKVRTVKINSNGKVTANGHEKETTDATDFLKAIGTPNKLMKQILKLVNIHMLNSLMKDSKWNKLADELEKYDLTLSDFLIIKCADSVGRIDGNNTKVDVKTRLDDYYKIVAKINKLNIMSSPLPKLVNGHDIINIAKEYGYKVPGKDIGKLLNEIRNNQYTGVIKSKTQAITYIRRRLCKR